jgi:hypothetical protein
MDQRSFSELAMGKLAAGSVPVREMHRLSERVDEYVTRLLTSLDAPMDVRVGSLGAFRPELPDDTEPLLELVHRLASSAALVSRLPRRMDVIMFQRVVLAT